MTARRYLTGLGILLAAGYLLAQRRLEVFNCGFGADGENDLCGFKNEFSTGGLEWKLVEDGGQRFMVANSEGLSGGLIARLGSMDMPLTRYQNGCLRFKYQMKGKGIGLFHVIVETFNMTSFSIKRWYTRGIESKEWTTHYIDLSSDTHVDIQTKLIFDVTTMITDQPTQSSLVKLEGVLLSLRDNCVILEDHDKRKEQYPSISDIIMTSPEPTISILENHPEVKIDVSQGVRGGIDILADIKENSGEVEPLEDMQALNGDEDLELGIQVNMGR